MSGVLGTMRWDLLLATEGGYGVGSESGAVRRKTSLLLQPDHGDQKKSVLSSMHSS